MTMDSCDFVRGSIPIEKRLNVRKTLANYRSDPLYSFIDILEGYHAIKVIEDNISMYQYAYSWYYLSLERFLMEGDIAITHAIRVEAFVGLTRGRVSIASVVPLRGKIPWGYEIIIGDKCFTMSANIVLDVVNCHQTLESAGEMLIEYAESAATIVRGTV